MSFWAQRNVFVTGAVDWMMLGLNAATLAIGYSTTVVSAPACLG